MLRMILAVVVISCYAIRFFDEEQAFRDVTKSTGDKCQFLSVGDQLRYKTVALSNCRKMMEEAPLSEIAAFDLNWVEGYNDKKEYTWSLYHR